MWKVVRRFAPTPLRCACSAWTQSPIEASEYVERRRRLIERVRRAAPKEAAQRPLLIVARSAKEHFSAPDVPYPFRQCSYFRYLTGLSLANVVLTILAQPNDEFVSTLYFDGRSAQEELWQGPAMTPAEIIAVSGIDEVKRHMYLQSDLEMQPPEAVVSFDLRQFPAKSERLAEVLARFGGMVPLREEIDRLRWVKSKTEQQLMRATCDVGGRAMNAMIAQSKGVRSENEIVGRLELESRRRGAAWLAYPPVVAAGNRANTIHYLDSNQAIDGRDVVLVDAGCEVHGYVSDITRVFPAGGHFSSAQRALCDALNDLQSELLRFVENVRPLRLNNLYFAMIEAMSKKLLEIGLFPNTITEQELLHETDKLCPHHVSHYLGMDVHDTASVPRNISLVPGVTFTVEPGIYVRKDNKLAREDFRGIGMRIEDDVLMTDDGVEVLTRHCARESADIERLMKL